MKQPNVVGAFECRKLVRFQHCDPAGIVFYPQYFVLFHELIEDWFNEGLQVNYANLISVRRTGVPTVHLEVDFKSPSKIGDSLRMQLAVTRVGDSSVSLALRAVCNHEVRVEISQTIVFLSLDRRVAISIPEDLRERMLQYAVRDDAPMAASRRE